MTRILTLLIVFILFSKNFYSQIDTEFWFAAPDVAIDGSNFLDRPVVIKITTFESPSNISISLPANPGVTPITATIPANSAQTFVLSTWIDLIENSPANTILNKGIRITASTPVTAYYEVISGGVSMPKNNPEAFVLKGKNALGKEFYIPSQNLVENSISYSPTPSNTFEIVATEDNTTIQITPKQTIIGHAAGVTFTIILDKGQTYCAKAIGSLPNQHLHGSHITSDKPIAITVTDDLLYGMYYGGGCADLAGDQIVPVTEIGYRYIATKTQLSGTGDYIFVTATQNGTQIFKDGGAVPIATINAGETHSFPIGVAQATYIEASNPIYVWQLAGSGCELGASILPTLDCTGSKEVSYMRSSNFQLYMNLLTRSENITGFQINGSPLASSLFSAVPGTSGEWMYAQINLPLATYPYDAVINVKNTLGVFHLATVDINGGGTSYGYFSNFGSIILEQSSDVMICEGDTIRLYGSGLPGAIHSWNGPEGFSSTLRDVVIPNATASKSGWYYYTLNADNCSGEDSVYVDVIGFPTIDYSLSDTGICIGEEVTVTINKNATETAKITPNIWSTSDGKNFKGNPTKTQTFYIEVENVLGCSSLDSFIIYVDSIPDLIVSADDSILGCDKFQTKLHAENGFVYYWQPAELCDNAFSADPTVTPTIPTMFIVTAYSPFGCMATDSIFINFEENGYELIPNAFSPNGDGLNETFRPYIFCFFEFEYFRIYNRWGEMVFETFDQTIPWNGIGKNGIRHDTGVFYWIISGRDKDGNQVYRKGDVTILK